MINVVAYTAVDKAKADEELATIINGDTPTAIALACVEIKIPFLHISGDYVFEGSSEKPWKPSNTAAPPQNTYVHSKLVDKEGIPDTGLLMLF